MRRLSTFTDLKSTSQGELFPCKTALTWAVAWFLVALVCLFILRPPGRLLTGSDPYYHLRFVSHVLEHGISTHEISWLRFSIFHDHWGDKEFLFRLFLLPFCMGDDMIAGGNLALTTLNALLAGLLGFIGVRWFGKRGILLPFALLASNTGLLPRLDLLRPHNLSLLCLLLGIYLVERKAYRRLGLLAAAYTLAYTAAHTLLLLCAGLFLLLAILQKKREWGLLIYPPIGFAAGLLLHPAWPHNLLIWKLTNLNFYVDNKVASLGTEIFPVPSSELFLSSSMALFLLAGALLTTRPWPAVTSIPRRELILGAVALVFATMTLLAFRFIEYAAPFGMLYGFALYDRLATNPNRSPSSRRTGDRFMSLLLVYAVAMNLFLAHTLGLFEARTRYFGTPEQTHAFCDALPSGARVAARWDHTAPYCFAAPQARFLNVVDPVYMHAFNPEIARNVASLFDGQLLDPVAFIRGPLDSDYIAMFKRNRALYLQLIDDPRLTTVYEDNDHLLAQVTSDGGFVTNWQICTNQPSSSDAWPGLPGAEEFVEVSTGTVHRALVSLAPDARTATPSQSIWWARRTVLVDNPTTIWVGFTSYGPATVYLNGSVCAQTSGTARIWRGEMRFPLMLTPGTPHEITVCVKPGPTAGGFFWRQGFNPSE